MIDRARLDDAVRLLHATFSSRRSASVASASLSHQPSAMTTVLDRFLRYVTYDTQSDEASTTYPSTGKQLVLLRDLADELQRARPRRRRGRRVRLRDGDDPGDDDEAGRAGDRVHRARRHVAGDAAAPASSRSSTAATTAAISCCPTIRPPCCGSPTTRRSPSRSATTSSPRRARRCWAPTTRPASPRS